MSAPSSPASAASTSASNEQVCALCGNASRTNTAGESSLDTGPESRAIPTCAPLWPTPTAHPRTHTPRQVDHGRQLANEVASGRCQCVCHQLISSQAVSPAKTSPSPGRVPGSPEPARVFWSEFARIVGELRPRFVIVENVPALAFRGLGRVLGDLAALGYDAEWDCLPASAFGAPHRRDRLWLVAYPNGQGEPGEPVDAGSGCGVLVPSVADHSSDGRGQGRQGRPDPSGPGQRERALSPLADPESEPERSRLCPDGPGGQRRRRPSDGGGARPDSERDRLEGQQQAAGAAPRSVVGDGRWWSVEPDVGRVAHGIPSRVDRLSALGDSLVPQIAEWIGRRLMSSEVAKERDTLSESEAA